MDILYNLILIMLLFLLIAGCCIFFTNAVEYLGKHLGVSQGGVGSVFAAIGTALPETLVPLVAIIGSYLLGKDITKAQDIGVGAILGSPFLLSTVALFITGFFVFLFYKIKLRGNDILINPCTFYRDLKFFIAGYTVALLAALIKFPYSKYLFGIFLLVFYFIYVYRTLRKNSCVPDEDENIEELYFTKLLKTKNQKSLLIAIFQVVISVVFLVYFVHIFVDIIVSLASLTGIKPLIISLFISPLATELPEMFNSIMWVKNSKDTLALSNITGALVYQACILPAIGIFFTPWILTQTSLINITFVYLAILTLYISALFQKTKITVNILCFVGIFWLLYVLYILLL